MAQLYSSEVEKRRAAVYRVLFDRRHDLLPELKKATSFEQNEEIAVFMVQVGLTLQAFPRDPSLERRIIEYLQRDDGAAHLTLEMWKYLETHGSSQMLVATMAAMGDAIPPDAQSFIESCLQHQDPDIRAAACEKAIKSGRPTHFAYVLNLITDPDPVVSETAFMVVKEMPVNELAIILDYALGSPDEWVLHNVAPFLPLLINNGLRPVISKFQYHKHPLVSKKAREALKTLDSVPYVSKRDRQKADEEAAAAAASSEPADSAEEATNEEPQLSFKEQMELKRQQKMAEEARKKAEEEAMAAELAKIQPDDLADFENEIASFDAVVTGGETPTVNLSDDNVPDEELFTSNTGFEDEAAMLDQIDPELAEIKIDVEDVNEEISVTASETEQIDAGESSRPAEEPPIENATENGTEKATDNTETVIAEDIVIEEPEFSAEASSQAEPLPAQELPVKNIDDTATPQPVESDQAVESSQESIEALFAEDDALSVKREDPVLDENKVDKTEDTGSQDEDIEVIDLSAGLPETESVSVDTSEMDFEKMQPAVAPVQLSQADSDDATDDMDDIQVEVVDEVAQTNVAEVVKQASPTAANAKEEAGSKISSKVDPAPSVGKTVIPAAAKEIISRYPSFISDPFAALFQPAKHDVMLRNIGATVDNLIAFLNLCYLQSCLFFAPQSDVLAKSIKECIKGHLTGPTALRCLHNFALAMKKTRNNPVFFTFSLAGILSESSDTNPLMMIRELKEFLRDPVMPLEESLPQAVEGLTEILKGVKSILNNNLVMKAPAGAREPFADLSGPEARILAAEKRPALDLPVGEVVLVSRDGTEALGLFPYFKYARKKVVYARPDDKEIAILLDRLEIPQDQL